MRDAAAGEGPGRHVRSAVMWNVALQAGNQVATVIVFIALARRLEPAVFGAFALAALVVDIVAVEARTALTDLLVIRRELTRRGLSLVLFAGSTLALALWAGLWAAAPALAAAFRAPDLAWLVPVLGVSVAFAPLAAVYEALALRDLRFKLVATRGLATSAVASAAALLTLVLYDPLWALPVQRLAGLGAGLLTLGLALRWTPSLARDSGRTPPLSAEFGKLWANQLLNFALARAVEAVVAVRLGVVALGLYRVTSRLVDLVHAGVSTPLLGVFVPVLSRAGDPAARREQVREIAALSALVCAPAFAGLALVADDLLRASVGPAYVPAAGALALLALCSLAAPITYFRGVVLMALRRSALAVGLGLADLAVTALLVWWGAGAGLEGALTGALAASALAALLSLWVLARALELAPAQLLGPLLPPYVGAMVMAPAVLLAQAGLAEAAPLLRLAAAGSVGAAAFGLYLFLAHRNWVRERAAFLQLAPGRRFAGVAPAELL